MVRIVNRILPSLFLLLSPPVYAQRTCATQEYARLISKQNINKTPQISNNQKIKTSALKSTSVITIPVVVHVIYKTAEQNISDLQIKSQIDVLNEDFAGENANRAQIPDAWKNLAGDMEFRFALAQRDSDGNFSNGITRTFTMNDQFFVGNDMKFDSTGGHAAWPAASYLNLWVCNLSNNILGYAQFPGNDPLTDGIVITTDAVGRTGFLQSKYDLGRTMTHEVGHWLGLLHIWGDNNCGNDQVNDTPVQKTANNGCNIYPKISCCNGNNNCNSPDGDMFMNYMDYTDDKCMMLFTAGQRIKMINELNLFRSALINSQGNTPTGLFSNDLEISGINSPSGQICDDDFNSSVALKNKGINVISSVKLNYRIDNDAVTAYQWNGLLNPGESVQVILGNKSASTALHTFHVWAEEVNNLPAGPSLNNYLSRSFLLSPEEYGCPVYPQVPEINISPNPASTELIVEARFKESPVSSVNMYDVRGKLLFSFSQNDSNGSVFRFNISGLANGLYFIQARTFNESSSEKFMIQH